MGSTKTYNCRRCGVFDWNARGDCRACDRTRTKRWRAENPGVVYAVSPERKRAQHLRFRYGLTTEQYRRMLSAQEGMCAICRMTPEPGGKNLSVDHNHVTGVVRDLLCTRCNLLVGAHESPLSAATRAYIEKHR